MLFIILLVVSKDMFPVTHSKERSFACRSRPRCVTLSVDLSSVNYERYSGDAGKSVNSGDRSGGLCVRDVD